MCATVRPVISVVRITRDNVNQPMRSANMLFPNESNHVAAFSVFRFIDYVLVLTLVFANMVHMTGLLLVASSFSVPAAIAVEYVIIAIYALVALVRGHTISVLCGGSWIVYLLAQCLVWNQITSLPINFNAVLSYGTTLMFLVFRETRVSSSAVLRLTLGLSVGYLAIYALFWQQIVEIAGRESWLYLKSDGVRGVRMYLAAPFVVFVFMYGLSVMRRSLIFGLVAIVVSGYAMILAQSRFAMAILSVGIVAAVVGSIARELRRGANFLLAGVFLLLSGLSLGGFVIPGWNPYLLLGTGGSGEARMIEYQDGIAALKNNLLTGFGIPANYDDLQNYVHPVRPFFVSDLGLAGLGMQFGLIFVFAFVVLCVRLMTVTSVPTRELDPLHRALFYTTQWSAFGALVGVTILGGPGTLFAALTIALWLRRDTIATTVV